MIVPRWPIYQFQKMTPRGVPPIIIRKFPKGALCKWTDLITFDMQMRAAFHNLTEISWNFMERSFVSERIVEKQRQDVSAIPLWVSIQFRLPEFRFLFQWQIDCFISTILVASTSKYLPLITGIIRNFWFWAFKSHPHSAVHRSTNKSDRWRHRQSAAGIPERLIGPPHPRPRPFMLIPSPREPRLN